jgi:hypothetical protein
VAETAASSWNKSSQLLSVPATVAPSLPVSSWRSRPAVVWVVVQELFGRPRLRLLAAAATGVLRLPLLWCFLRAALPVMPGDFSSTTSSSRGVSPADALSSAPRSRRLRRVVIAATPTGLASAPYRPERVIQRPSLCSSAFSGSGEATSSRWTAADSVWQETPRGLFAFPVFPGVFSVLGTAVLCLDLSSVLCCFPY